MPELQEPKTERVSLALTPTEAAALDFVRRIHGDRYDGVSSVLRDYSISDAVAAHKRATATVAGEAA